MIMCSFSKAVGSETSCPGVLGSGSGALRYAISDGVVAPCVLDWSNLALPSMAWRLSHRAILSGFTAPPRKLNVVVLSSFSCRLCCLCTNNVISFALIFFLRPHFLIWDINCFLLQVEISVQWAQSARVIESYLATKPHSCSIATLTSSSVRLSTRYNSLTRPRTAFQSSGDTRETRGW